MAVLDNNNKKTQLMQR